MIGSRVFALALFASLFIYPYIAFVVVLHWLAMFGWIVSMKTSFCNNTNNKNCFQELFYNALLAVIFIFCYFNPVDSPTRWRYTFYYVILFIENTILMSVWYCWKPKMVSSNGDDTTNTFFSFSYISGYRLTGFIAFFLCFAAGLVFMVSLNMSLMT